MGIFKKMNLSENLKIFKKSDKDLYCANCGIRTGVITRQTLIDDRCLCVNCQNALPSYYMNKYHKMTAEEYGVIYTYITGESKELKKKFAPEFLNRLDAIIYFNSLDEDNLKKIIKLEIDKSVKRFKDIGFDISYNESAIEHLLKEIGEESDYGARPIIRAVQNEIEDPLTDIILENECNEKMSISFDDDNIIIDVDK